MQTTTDGQTALSITTGVFASVLIQNSFVLLAVGGMARSNSEMVTKTVEVRDHLLSISSSS